MVNVIVTGASGFVGSAVARRLEGARVLANRRPVLDKGVEVWPGDLTDPASLHGLCDGRDTLLHLASQIGGDFETCHEVNTIGTANLLAEADRAGIGRVIYLSTAAVYRDGVHRGADVGDLELDPSSPTSRTRLAAERLVLAAGGVVLRPHLIYGPGDRWVVPGLLGLLEHLGTWVNDGAAQSSVIHVHDLARAIAALARLSDLPRGEVLHANHPSPVTIRQLVEAFASDLPERSMTLAEALDLLGPAWARRLSLIGNDHWYLSSRLWQITGEAPAHALD
ncbi:hypothetical protein Lesp02_44590 [Lentzea sp. NBRC 105346]|uniref:NAD-dependent epimerase/dehydratase family protein n=1 Tax=Lentzea sp. NBRC 105346 TaxID=3032205 RepID=UPI0024A174B6|nr:NAD(P)-dependent oxidoreductase [Lentzea sp. NBRC 105346]GLZ32271.1 hypothetical protein Lesp02_44590 [Lentzea sp. NBRC 105346]